ncbi:MAG: hypothetical protein WCH00_02480 [Candidatus Saccharibacteria bacterium]
MKKISLYLLGLIALASLLTLFLNPGRAYAGNMSWRSNSYLISGQGEWWLDVGPSTKYSDVLVFKNNNNGADGYVVLSGKDNKAYWLKNVDSNFNFGNIAKVKQSAEKVDLIDNGNRTTRSYARNAQGHDMCTTYDGADNDCYGLIVSNDNWKTFTNNGKTYTIADDGSFKYNGGTKYFACDTYTKVGQKCWNGRDAATLTEMTQEKHDKLHNNSLGVAAAKTTSGCVDSPLSFFLCPISDLITNTWSTILNWFIDLLQNPTLSSTNPDGTPSSVNAALRSFINLANGVYILVFIAIIFANFFAVPGLDNYSIKKMLPRLIGAIIITQFSFLICGAILDITNIIGNLLPQLILRAFGDNSVDAAHAFVCTLNPLAQVGFSDKCPHVADSLMGVGIAIDKFLLLFLTELVGLCVAIYALIYLIFRYMFLVILIIISPLAFAAWVLPNTEQYFRKWWSYFFRLSIMFLLVNTLFAFGAELSNTFQKGLGGSVSDAFLTSLIAIFIPTITIALVPRMLKVSGQVMTAAKDGIKKLQSSASGSLPGRMAKTSLQQGKLAEVKGGAMQKFGEKLGGRDGKLGNFGIGMEAKGAALKMKPRDALQEDVSKLHLGRQMEIASKTTKDKSGNLVPTKQAAAAKVVMAKKLQELSNTRNLSATQLVQLEALKGSISASELKSGGSYTALDGKVIDFGENGRATAVDRDPSRSNELFENPNWII